VPSELNLLVDGLIVDPIPVKLVHEMGCHFSVAINAMAIVDPQKLKRRYPFNILDIVIRSFFVMGHEIGQARATQAADVVFTPNMGEIGPVDFSSSRELIECGRKAAEENLPAILASYESLKTTR